MGSVSTQRYFNVCACKQILKAWRTDIQRSLYHHFTRIVKQFCYCWSPSFFLTSHECFCAVKIWPKFLCAFVVKCRIIIHRAAIYQESCLSLEKSFAPLPYTSEISGRPLCLSKVIMITSAPDDLEHTNETQARCVYHIQTTVVFLSNLVAFLVGINVNP